MTDREMREPLFDYLEEFYGKIRILEEKNAGTSRADVIGVVDGALLGFEIKSDRDSYTRLKTQTRDYDRFCDWNYLVVGKSHLLHAHEHIPAHWGILVVWEEEGGVRVEMDQLPGRNPGAELRNQLSFLWRPELALLQEQNGLPAYRQKSKAFVQEKLLELVPGETLKRQMTDLLFERDYGELLEEIRQEKIRRSQKRRDVKRSRAGRCGKRGRRRSSGKNS